MNRETMTISSDADARDLLREAVARAGSQGKLGAEIGVSSAAICLMLSGKKRVSQRVARHLGVRVAGPLVTSARGRGHAVPDELADDYEAYRRYAPSSEPIPHTLDLARAAARRAA